tara:strand:- start:1156 stop:1539 length:384 start_codon:yes stop_codon:yes gene_type:complete
MAAAMKKLLKDREDGNVGSLIQDIVKHRPEPENFVSFPKLLSDNEMVTLGLTFVKFDAQGSALYKNSQLDEDDDQYTENDALLLKWMVAMIDWETLKQEFTKRGIKVTGPDRHTIMLRGIEAFSKMQ